MDGTDYEKAIICRNHIGCNGSMHDRLQECCKESWNCRHYRRNRYHSVGNSGYTGDAGIGRNRCGG